MWTVRMIKEPMFCGRGAANIPFINGEAKVEDQWLAEWFMSKPDIYEVTKIRKSAKE